MRNLVLLLIGLHMSVNVNAQSAEEWSFFYRQLFEPDSGRTLLLVGQTFIQEYDDYIISTQIPPAGSSHYGEIYNGWINQGDDWNMQTFTNDMGFLNHVHGHYPGHYAQVAISIKDNPGSGGFNSAAQACVAIVNGQLDVQIDQLSQVFKQYADVNWMVRIGYEVNQNMFGAGGEFAAAYNYIASRIRLTNEVANAAFIYHPVRGVTDFLGLWPGEEFVDWIGISIFNHDVCVPTWETVGCCPSPPFENPGCWYGPHPDTIDMNLAAFFEWATYEKKKPVMICESACQTDMQNQWSTEHFKTYFDRLFWVIETYDVHALCYINSEWSAQHNWPAHWGDSRVQALPEVLNYWMDKITAPRYVHYPGYNTLPDCNKVPGGGAFTDSCGTCAGGNTGTEPCAITSLVDGVSPNVQLSLGSSSKGVLHLLLEGGHSGDAELMVSELTGRTLVSPVVVTIDQGSRQVEVEIPEVATGMLIVYIKWCGQQFAHKIIWPH